MTETVGAPKVTLHDLLDAEAFTCSGRILVGDFCDCCSSDVTIITAGVSKVVLKSRLDGLKETAPIIRGLVEDIVQHNPRGILLIASNPVDVLTYAAWKWSARVIGSGTALDTSRLRRQKETIFRIIPQAFMDSESMKVHLPASRDILTCSVLTNAS